MQIKLLFNCLVMALSASSVITTLVEVVDDGPAVIDIPIVFNATLKGDVQLVNQFMYVFEDTKGLYREIISGKDASISIVYTNVDVGYYSMKVQVFTFIWGFKGWFVAQDNHQFEIKNGPLINMNITQNGVKSSALSNNMVCTNRTANLTAIIIGSPMLRNGQSSYTWMIDTHTYKSSATPYLTVNFTQNKIYNIAVIVMVNVSQILVNKTYTKIGESEKSINAKNGINAINVNGNTWLMHGALLQLDVNCTGGTPPFQYCWDIDVDPKINYSCKTQDLIKIDNCSFPIMHYFPDAHIYYVDIGIENDIEFAHQTIQVNVYNSTRESQLSFVIIPIASSIIAIIIVVVGVAYHLQQRQRYNITLEVADFDFQRNEDLYEKTFFGRLKESFSKSVRVTLMHPCLSAQNYDDIIDDNSIPPQTPIPVNISTDSIISQTIDTNDTNNTFELDFVFEEKLSYVSERTLVCVPSTTPDNSTSEFIYTDY